MTFDNASDLCKAVMYYEEGATCREGRLKRIQNIKENERKNRKVEISAGNNVEL